MPSSAEKIRQRNTQKKTTENPPLSLLYSEYAFYNFAANNLHTLDLQPLPEWGAIIAPAKR